MTSNGLMHFHPYSTQQKMSPSQSTLLSKQTWDSSCWSLYNGFKFFSSQFSSVQFISIAQPCLTLCDPMDCSTPGLPAHHQLLELTQTHVHRVDDGIHPTISSSVAPFSSCPPSFSTSGSFPVNQLFPSGGPSIGASTSASVLPMNIRD